MSTSAATPVPPSFGMSINAQDIVDDGRFERANSLLSNLAAAADQDYQAMPSPPSRALVVRHTFSMSESDSAIIDTLRKAAGARGTLLSASDICRIGLHAISSYTGDDVIAAVNNLERLRPGRQS